MIFSAGILAGGRSVRMGRDKALLDAGGVPLIDYVRERLARVCGEVLISAREPHPFASRSDRVVLDEISIPSALSGIHALLKAASRPTVFVLAVDMPYVNPDLIESLAKELGTFDALIPCSAAGPEPLHAFYTRRCVAAIEAAAAEGRFKIADALGGCRIATPRVEEGKWEVLGSSPFGNLNSPEHYQEFLKKISASREL